MKIHLLLFSCCVLFVQAASAQSLVTRDIKSFGAKGDGKTNDHAAFEKAAAYFNARKGKGKLVVSKGTYVVGRQIFTQGKDGKPAFDGADVLYFTGLNNFTIQGQPGAKLKYANGLKYGSFNPETGKPHQPSGYFTNWAYAAKIGHCIFIDNSSGVTMSSLELDGNNQSLELGGSYGDVGRQLPHYGIFIQNSRSVKVQGVNLHHFALDGICVANKASTQKDDIQLLDSRFEYNSRQGFSWIGGNELTAKRCKFNHTGRENLIPPRVRGLTLKPSTDPYEAGSLRNANL